jgi:hypothetical protein
MYLRAYDSVSEARTWIDRWTSPTQGALTRALTARYPIKLHPAASPLGSLTPAEEA